MARRQARRDGAAIMSALLSIDAVSKRFRGLLAVDNVSFRVAQGSIFAVIEPGKPGGSKCVHGVAAIGGSPPM